MKDAVTIRIDSKMNEKLKRLAEETALSKSFLASEAIRHYIDLNEWRLMAIKEESAKQMPVNSYHMRRFGQNGRKNLRILWTRVASNDLDSIEEYIRQENPNAAVKQVLRILDVVENTITANPFIGHPGRLKTTREFVVAGSPYIIIYRIRDESIEVIRVLHGARKWPVKS